MIKKTLVAIFASLLLQSSYGQQINCCDSIVKFLQKTKTLKNRKISSTHKNQASNQYFIFNNNQNFELTPLKQDKPTEGWFDIFFKYFKDVFGPAVALLGILLALPILRKKLLENHVVAALSNIQNSNLKVHQKSQNLIDDLLPLTFSNDPVSKEEVEKLFTEAKQIYYLGLNASSDVATVLYYLKCTLQGTVKFYRTNDSGAIISSREIYGLVIDVLDMVNFYSTQIVQAPKSIRMEKVEIINKKISKFVTRSNLKKYKYFDQGIFADPNSAHFTWFYSKVNPVNNSLIKRAAFQIHTNIAPIAKLIFLKNIYAPLEITKKSGVHDIFGDKKLFLIGFSAKITIGEENPRRTIDLEYANPNDFLRFTSSLKFETITDNFTDSFLAGSDFKLSESKGFSSSGFETITLSFDLNYLQEMFLKNRIPFIAKLKSFIEND